MIKYGGNTSQNDSSERKFGHIEKISAKFFLSDSLVFLFFFCYNPIAHVFDSMPYFTFISSTSKMRAA